MRKFSYMTLVRALKPLCWFMNIKTFPSQTYVQELKSQCEKKGIVYVLPQFSFLDILILRSTLKKYKFPKPEVFSRKEFFKKTTLLFLFSKNSGLNLYKKNAKYFLRELSWLIEKDKRFLQEEVSFCPVSVFWTRESGTNTKKQRRFFPADHFLLTPLSLFQKLAMLLFHRGEVTIVFGKLIPMPVLSQEILDRKKDAHSHFIKRQILIEFQKKKTAVLGPKKYSTGEVLRTILASPETQAIIDQAEHPERIRPLIQKYFLEMTSDYRYVAIRFFESLLTLVLTRVFKGIRVRGVEMVENVSKESQVLWLPCHKSHFDYLLLSYTLLRAGLMAPYIAAGINLAFWPVGMLLRRSGAFFIRRSFSGNKLYSHVFSQYIHFLLKNSFPIEFFQEGSRSRIGKLLFPKIGLLSICVKSILNRKAYNTALIPVSFGYDRIMETESYAKELDGAKKKNENMWFFILSTRKLLSDFGHVDVSFGKPLIFKDALFAYLENKKITEDDLFIDDVFYDFVEYLSLLVQDQINAAATASHTALLASYVLTVRDQGCDHKSIHYYLSFLSLFVEQLSQDMGWNLKNTLSYLPHDKELLSPMEKSTENIESYRASVVAPIIKDGISWRFLEKTTTGFKVAEEKENQLWWYRGTIFHIIALPGILAELLELEIFEEDKLEIAFTEVLESWRYELFLDFSVGIKKIFHSVLHFFEMAGLVSIKKGKVQVLSPSISSLALLILPEKEVYGILLAHASTHQTFSKEHLLRWCVSAHQSAFLCSQAFYKSTLSQTTGRRAFEVLLKAGIIVRSENGMFEVKEISESFALFLGMEKWKKIIGP